MYQSGTHNCSPAPPPEPPPPTPLLVQRRVAPPVAPRRGRRRGVLNRHRPLRQLLVVSLVPDHRHPIVHACRRGGSPRTGERHTVQNSRGRQAPTTAVGRRLLAAVRVWASTWEQSWPGLHECPMHSVRETCSAAVASSQVKKSLGTRSCLERSVCHPRVSRPRHHLRFSRCLTRTPFSWLCCVLPPHPSSLGRPSASAWEWHTQAGNRWCWEETSRLPRMESHG